MSAVGKRTPRPVDQVTLMGSLYDLVPHEDGSPGYSTVPVEPAQALSDVSAVLRRLLGKR